MPLNFKTLAKTLSYLFLGVGVPVGASAAEFEVQGVEEFAVRALGELSITNLRGAVEVTPWAQDKVRIVARKRVRAATPEEAKTWLDSAVVSHFQGSSGVEVKAEYGRGLDLSARLRERKEQRVAMDFLVQAPVVLKLRILTQDGEVGIRGWKGHADLKTQRGRIRVEGFRGKSLGAWCERCLISIRNSSGEAHLRNSEGKVELFDYSGDRVFVEGKKLEVFADQVRSASQVYSFTDGRLLASELSGHFEFLTRKGSVEILQSEGSVLGHSDSGNVKVELRKWVPRGDRDFIETGDGSIDFRFPEVFEGQVDVRSDAGMIELQHPAAKVLTPQTAELKRGWSRAGLRVSSKRGRVRVSAFSLSG